MTDQKLGFDSDKIIIERGFISSAGTLHAYTILLQTTFTGNPELYAFPAMFEDVSTMRDLGEWGAAAKIIEMAIIMHPHLAVDFVKFFIDLASKNPVIKSIHPIGVLLGFLRGAQRIAGNFVRMQKYVPALCKLITSLSYEVWGKDLLDAQYGPDSKGALANEVAVFIRQDTYPGNVKLVRQEIASLILNVYRSPSYELRGQGVMIVDEFTAKFFAASSLDDKVKMIAHFALSSVSTQPDASGVEKK